MCSPGDLGASPADDLLAALERGALGSFDLVLHMGACSSTTETDATYLVRNIYEFSKSLASWSLLTDARFVYASSAATYGSGDQGMSDADDSPTALYRLRPLNMYGYSKQMFDLWAARNDLFDRITGLKYFNIFGPNEVHKGEMRSLVAKAVPQIAESGVLRLFRSHRPDYADGRQLRDFLYVKDATEMTLHLAGRPDATGIFNIGSGRAASWLDVGTALFAALERDPAIEFIDMPANLSAIMVRGLVLAAPTGDGESAGRLLHQAIGLTRDLCDFDFAESLARELPRGRLVLIPRAAHAVMFERSGVFNDSVIEFARSLEEIRAFGDTA